MPNKPTCEELEAQIYDLKRKLKEQKQNHNFLYKTILDTIPCPIFFKDKNGIYQDCNTAFAELILGAPKENLIGKRLEDFSDRFPPSMLKKYIVSDNKIFETGEPDFYDGKVLCVDGKVRHYSLFKSPIKNSTNEITAIVGLMLDITDRVNKQLELEATEKRFKLLQEASFGGLVIHDMGKILDLNNKACKILGYPRTELIALNATQLIIPEQRDDAKRRLTTKETDPYELKITRKNGEEADLLLRSKFINYRGQEARATELWDITKEKEIKKKLENEFESIFENSSIGLLLMKKDRTFYRVNNRILEILGYDQDDLIKSLGTSIKPFHSSEKVFEEFGQKHIPLIKQGQKAKIEMQLKKKNGEKIWCLLYGKALNPQQPDEDILWIIDDINEKKQLELEREKLVSELKEALENVKTLKGLLPICAGCKKIRNDKGYWEHVEVYIKERSDTEFSHGLCHECAKKMYGDEDWFDEEDFDK
jgi:PAS domain S-box-containing protein